MVRLFGFTVGVLSTSYFVLVFWLIIQGFTVRIFEQNALVAMFELLMAVSGLGVLLGALFREIARWR